MLIRPNPKRDLANQPKTIEQVRGAIGHFSRKSILRITAEMFREWECKVPIHVRLSEGSQVTASAHQFAHVAINAIAFGRDLRPDATPDDVLLLQHMWSMVNDGELQGLANPSEDDLLRFLVRLAWDQAPVARGQFHAITYGILSRSGEKVLSDAWNATFSLDIQEWYRQLVLIHALMFLKPHFWRADIESLISQGITTASIYEILDDLSSTTDDLARNYREMESTGDLAKYSYIPLVRNPIVKMSATEYVVPIPNYLNSAGSSGVVFRMQEAAKSDVFAAFGFAFERYVGELLNGYFQVYPEHEYFVGKDEWSGFDFVATRADEVWLIECRTARFRLDIKSSGDYLGNINILRDRLGRTADKFDSKIDHILRGLTNIAPMALDGKSQSRLIVVPDEIEASTRILELLGKSPSREPTPLIVSVSTLAMLVHSNHKLTDLAAQYRSSYYPVRSGDFGTWLAMETELSRASAADHPVIEGDWNAISLQLPTEPR